MATRPTAPAIEPPADGGVMREVPPTDQPALAADARIEASPAEADEGATLGVLGNRHFMVLWLSQVATQVGGNMVLYGLTVLFTSEHNLVLNSLLLVSFLAPAVVFGALAGVFVDRFDRRAVLVLTSLVRGSLFVAIALFTSSVWLILVLNVVISIASTFFAPAELAMIPRVVGRRQLTAANGAFTLTLNAAFAVGYTMLGPLLTSILPNAGVLVVIVAILYFVSSALCFTLPAAPPTERHGAGFHQAERAVEGVLDEFREGLGFIRDHPGAAWALLYLATAGAIVGVLGTVGARFAQDVLSLEPKDFVVIVLPLGFGVVLGALLLNVIGDGATRRRLIEIGLALVGVSIFLIGLVGPISRFLLRLSQVQPVLDLSTFVTVFSIVMVLAVVAGVGYAAIAIPAQTALQQEIPTEVRGRVFGVLNTLVSLASLVPIIIVGPVAQLVGVLPVMLACAALVFSVSVASVVFRSRGQEAAGGGL